jgi:hypothetical protein
MIDQPRGDLEKTAGTGGAVCIMKMYNHRDASVAAEFIGGREVLDSVRYRAVQVDPQGRTVGVHFDIDSVIPSGPHQMIAADRGIWPPPGATA